MHFTSRCLSGDEQNAAPPDEVLKMKSLYAERLAKRLQWVTLGYKSWPCSAQSNPVAYVLLMQHTVWTNCAKKSLCHFHIHKARHTYTAVSTSMLLSHPLQFPQVQAEVKQLNSWSVYWLWQKEEEAAAAFAYRLMRYTLNLNVSRMRKQWQVQQLTPSLARSHDSSKLKHDSGNPSWSRLLLLNSWRALTFKKWRR